MSLDVSKSVAPKQTEYFVYLKAHKILKSMFSEKRVLTGVLLLSALVILKISGVKWNEIKKLGGKLTQIHKRINALVVQFSDSLTDEKIKFLEELLDAEIKPVKQVTALLDSSTKQIGIPEVVEKYGYDGDGIKVAVLDTGINDNHEDIQGRVIARKRFVGGADVSTMFLGEFLSKVKSFFSGTKTIKLDGHGHGTHCAVVVGGNGDPYRGVAPKVALIDGKVLGDNGSGSDAGVVRGMSWAASQGADIISLSLGTAGGDPDDAVCREANALAEDGIIVVVAAGNEGPKNKTVGSPGAAEKVITVGSVDKTNRVPDYSSRGPVRAANGEDLKKPDILAPGGGTSNVYGKCHYDVGIISGKSPETRKDKCSLEDSRGVGYQKMSGTSMATPHVAGVCALLLQASGLKKINKKRSEIIKSVIRLTATNLKYDANTQGAGLIDVKKAVEKARVIGSGGQT